LRIYINKSLEKITFDSKNKIDFEKLRIAL
jgi:hypothetical protein